MKSFTVLGFWIDSLQRFATFVEANGPDEAEDSCIREHPDIAVCAVLRGRQQCVDTAEYVRAGLD